MAKEKNIVVLGMHRSGTSMFTEMLSNLGFFVGDERELLVPQNDNQRGFFERRDVVELNDRILKDSGGAWFDPPTLSVNRSYDSDISAIIDRLRTSDGPWVIKDPRLALTWPLWESFFDDATVVFIYRTPFNVSASLQARHGFPIGFGLDLWELYNRKSLNAVSNRKRRLFFSFDEFSCSPEQQANILYSHLRELDLLHSDIKQSKEAIDIFNPQLTNSSNDHFPDTLMTASQISLVSYFDNLSKNISPSRVRWGRIPKSDKGLDARISDFAQAIEPLSNARENRDRMTEIHTERNEIYSQLKSLESSYDAIVEAHAVEKDTHKKLVSIHRELESDHRQLSRAHTAEKDTHKKLVSIHRELESGHRRLADAHSLEIRAHASLLKEFKSLNAEQKRLAQAHRVEIENNKKLIESLGQSEKKSLYLFNQLTNVYRRILVYETSVQARVSRALNWFYRFLTLRYRGSTPYLEIVEESRNHFQEYQLEIVRSSRGRIALVLKMVRYILSNPISSMRSFSWVRVRRLFSVMFGMNRGDLETWVDARFPSAEISEKSINMYLDPDGFNDLTLEFCQPDQPQVSILIPVHNQYQITIGCLKSILENTKDVSYEIILADDFSTDLTRTIEDRVSGIKLVRQKNNVGFLRNCNYSAREAIGEFLVLLNNDTLVQPAWLTELLEPFKEDKQVGMVGPKLLFGDGSLQEAGGIIWRDGSGWNFGRGESSHLSAFNYLKQVDYVSGACLLLRRDLWNRLGGFDEKFCPAYYEDTDLAFSIRAAGFKVLYQPKASVIHLEGKSNGTNPNSGIKKFQFKNKEIFRKKWATQLEDFHYENGEDIFYARDRSGRQRTVLVIDHYVPHFDRDAGGRSTYQYLLLLVELGYKVLFMGANFFPHQPYTDNLQRKGVEVLVGEDIARNVKSWFQSHASYIDVIYLHRPHVAEQFIDIIETLNPKPLFVYFGHDLHYLRTRREALITSSTKLKKEADSWQKREYSIFSRSDLVYYASQAEINEIKLRDPSIKARTIPLYALPPVHIPEYRSDNRSGLIFVGGFNHPPNVDGILWFVKDIFPYVIEKIPEICLYVVGSNVPESIKSLKSTHLKVLGFLSDADLEELYSSVRLAVVPLRFGAGVKGKVIEAVQQNVPVISTTVGVEGIPDSDTVIFVVDDPNDFSRKLVDVYENPKQINTRLENYQTWLSSHFDKNVASQILLEDFGSPEKIRKSSI